MKRLIYQVCLGEKSKLYDFCTASVEEYCERQGIDYICQTDPILKIRPNPFQTNRSKQAVERLGYLPIYEKENAFDLLEEYDEIAIVDADIYIRKNAPNVFGQFQRKHPDKLFGAVVEREMPITPQYARKITAYSHGQYKPLSREVDFDWNNLGAEFMNMGFMIFRKGLQKYIQGSAKEFLSQERFQKFVDGLGSWKWSTDQTLLNYWIRADKVPYARLNWRWNALYRAVSDERLPHAHFIHFFLKDHLPQKGDGVEQLLTKENLL